jgi:hypothetical protein
VVCTSRDGSFATRSDLRAVPDPRASDAGDVFASAIDGWREQAQDVELVGDEADIGEEVASSVFERVAQVEHDPADVVAAWHRSPMPEAVASEPKEN